MAQVVEVPHAVLSDDDEYQIDIPGQMHDDGDHASERSPPSRRFSKRVKITSGVAILLSLVALCVGLVAHSSDQSSSASTKDGASNEHGTVSSETLIASTKDAAPFLQVAFADNGGTDMFMLQKEFLNASFLVVPTVVKHSAPMFMGVEYGSSMLLEISDYFFHFELSDDASSLVFVQDNYLARLQSDNDELKKAFDDSQWPGYITKITISTETDDAYFFSMYTFLSNGFFVSSYLMSSSYSVHESKSSFFPRNAQLQVEYEVPYGVVVVSYGISLLPETVMPQRVADDRVGYFSLRYTRYGVDNNDPANSTTDNRLHFMDPVMTVINRRRLELNNTTNQTINPIVFYIDPSVPLRWQDDFAAGVEAWKPAFKKIGFPNAIRAVKPGDRDWPSDYHVGDLRYNSISVVISDETYAIAPSVQDPRSGEILHSGIIFDYGFFDQVISDFDLKSPVQPPPKTPTTTTTPTARRTANKNTHSHGYCGIEHQAQYKLERSIMSFALGGESRFVSDKTIGQHFMDIVMHEVGHTLGLRHNFAGTAVVSREQLNDPNYVATNGLSSSIMDYIPINIFSDLNDTQIPTHGFFMTRIGSYDEAAIAYGYSIVDDEVPGYKSQKLSTLAEAAPFFLTDEDSDALGHPLAQRFDLSSDPIDYANDRLQLILRIRNSSMEEKIPDDSSWTALWRREHLLLKVINNSIKRLQPFLGGVNLTHAHRHHNEKRYSPVPISSADQKRALAVLSRIIRAEEGLFPDPSEYSSFIAVNGDIGEDCSSPSLEYYCQARGLVDLDKRILEIRQHAVLASIFPAVDRIIAQDVTSPLTLRQVFMTVHAAVSANAEQPRNAVLLSFYYDVLQEIVDSPREDYRLRKAILSLYALTPSPLQPEEETEGGASASDSSSQSKMRFKRLIPKR